ncbi:MAG: HNH endonuclease signature motif containing protein, partial [Rhizonema sp. PD38]|nr:HNH endonuclease signature motif containing protein [Rhizonema sp. PD38]
FLDTRPSGLLDIPIYSGEFVTESFTVEHIKPRQVGGENTLENLAWSCFGCNSHKHTKTYSIDPITGQSEALFNARQQFWNEHFSWSSDKSEVIGKTPCGRATVEALRLNRAGVVNLRRLLFMAGVHLPDEVSFNEINLWLGLVKSQQALYPQ